MTHALQILAGPRALARIRDRGLRLDDVRMMVGASGGPKWLAIAGLDRVLFPRLAAVEREARLHLLGSSIGSWRMACAAQADPLAAVRRLEEAYVERQRYDNPDPDAAEVSRVARVMLDHVLGEDGIGEILANARMALHVVTVRCRGMSCSENRLPLALSMAIAGFANAVSRKTLGWQFERVIFGNGSDSPFQALRDLPTRVLPLDADNLRAALLASGSIPLVLEGVEVPGAPRGKYRDGGLTDYHFDIDFGMDDGIVLYPHFYDHLVPGWFDKALPWRRARGRNLDNLVLLAPSQEFVTALPGGRIPDRKDFYRYPQEERIRLWRAVIDASTRLGDEFEELMASGNWLDRVAPL